MFLIVCSQHSKFEYISYTIMQHFLFYIYQWRLNLIVSEPNKLTIFERSTNKPPNAFGRTRRYSRDRTLTDTAGFWSIRMLDIQINGLY